MNNMISIHNEFFSQERQKDILKYCERALYKYGEVDTNATPPTGVTHDILPGQCIHKIIRAQVDMIVPKGLSFYHMYVNLFSPNEIPYFHIDGNNGVTLLYYPQYNWKPDDGGETQIFLEENIHGVVPLPNRLLMFDARMLHRATSFRDRHRFTVAIKYKEND